jgi:hypothetical protein
VIHPQIFMIRRSVPGTWLTVPKDGCEVITEETLIGSSATQHNIDVLAVPASSLIFAAQLS